MASVLNRWCKAAFLGLAGGIREGRLQLVCPDTTYEFGDPGSTLRAAVAVHDDRFFTRAVLKGDVGMGESFMDGDWSSPDLVSGIRLAVRNLAHIENGTALLSTLSRAADTLSHRRRSNTVGGSRRNIGAHYDLSNDFFRLFLDRRMVYSSAVYADAGQSLDEAQVNKLDLICRKLRLGSQDHVLEIGTGWGAFALYAVRHYGCRVTTTTISRQQYAYAHDLFRREGAGRIDLLFEDYRNLRGQYDKVVSIEMFEAVGREHYDDFFRACDRLLNPRGTMLLQTITILEQRFERYARRCDWIQKYIFPGAELASVAGILQSLARCTGLSPFHLEEIGSHYARTLRCWRERFMDRVPAVRGLGYDERFIRMWEYYLAYCEGAFSERHIGDVQLVLTKNYNPLPLVHEPWSAAGCEDSREEDPEFARTTPGK
jgi:cyclopropane-fatty-acyl-phospholipid synthase